MALPPCANCRLRFPQNRIECPATLGMSSVLKMLRQLDMTGFHQGVGKGEVAIFAVVQCSRQGGEMPMFISNAGFSCRSFGCHCRAS